MPSPILAPAPTFPPPEAPPFLGRTLRRLQPALGLQLELLAGQRVLDVAAGPSSLAAELIQHGVAAVAVDPLYSFPTLTLDHLGRTGLAVRPGERPGDLPLNLDGEPVPDLVARDEQQALRVFLTDYAGGRASGRYLAASLPELPFLRREFRIVTCSNFLFRHPDTHDPAFLVASCRELARVCCGEVRIFPFLPRSVEDQEHLFRHLRHSAITPTVEPVGDGPPRLILRPLVS